MIPQMTVSCPPPSTSEREEQARALCLRLLTARSRTRAELAGQLAKRGYPEDIGNRVLDRLAALGLVDDTDFAEQWVQSRRANAAKSKRALAAELHAKGVDDDVITTVLGGIDAGAERGRAEKLVRAKAAAGGADRRRHRRSAGEPQAGGDVGAPWVRPDLGVRGGYRRAGRRAGAPTRLKGFDG